MACDLTTGRTEPCKDSIGGLKNAFFLDYLENAFTVSDSQGTGIAVGVTEVFKYELRSDTNNDATESMISNKDAGTSVNTQTVNVRLKKQDAATSNEIKLMAYARPIIAVQDRNNVYKVYGLSEGMDLTASNIQSGAARADFNGYDLTFTSLEGEMAPILDSATVTALEALVSATNINP
ncbi:hypothetical protein [Flagellimonas sp. CMM7]|uniref:hypothetical protein n=1 Tax=Flagellimonas sp. CMM7 TaxID=2654676 RepID=UPI0013D2E1D9|nr:hypothetical protein [Flagellimonas sp. CMM7]UII80001.1 hypothetical protein LV704_00420 [Flagellimonas sp. CMM7]